MNPIPVVTQGFGWTAAGAWASFFLLLGVIVRQLGPWRKIKIGADEKLRDELSERVTLLEQRLERREAEHASEIAIMRHRLNNMTGCFDALLMLIETAPDKAMEAVEKIKEMRARQILAEAQEKAIVAGAKIQAAGDGA